MVSTNSGLVLQISILVVLAIFLGISLWFSLTNKLKYDRSKIYEDKDGVATAESQQKYSVGLYNVLLLVVLVAGVGLGLTVAILGTIHSWSSLNILWMEFSAWVS
jgi:hypothetical protein